jgi:hypothetical protein
MELFERILNIMGVDIFCPSRDETRLGDILQNASTESKIG